MNRVLLGTGIAATLLWLTIVVSLNVRDRRANFFGKRGGDQVKIRKYDEAIADYNQAISLEPNFARLAARYGDRGCAWHRKGDLDQAIADFDTTLCLDPLCANAYNNRGNAWAAKRDYDKAVADYNQAIYLDPDTEGNYNNRGNAWMVKHEYAKAIADYRQAIQLNPAYALALNNLASLQATCPDARYRDGKEALVNAVRACRLQRAENWLFVSTLAAAYAENGDLPQACRCQTLALDMVASSGNDREEERQRARLELYKQGKPCRD